MLKHKHAKNGPYTIIREVGLLLYYDHVLEISRIFFMNTNNMREMELFID